jgi:hypothetical protein
VGNSGIPSRMGGSALSEWCSFLLARSTKYTPLRSLLWWSVCSNNSSKATTRLSAWAVHALALASSTLALRHWASAASAWAIMRLTWSCCRSHSSSRASRHPGMATTVGSSSWDARLSKVRTLASQAGQL